MQCAEYARFAPTPAQGPLSRIAKTRFVIDEAAHDTARHFAATSDTGLLQVYAPEIVDLSLDSLVAIVAHEFGHTADYAYPGCWTWLRRAGDEVAWVGESTAAKAAAWRWTHGKARATSRTASDDTPPAANWMRAWAGRSQDEVEWTADGICAAVTGKKPLYCGDCRIQCFDGGVQRPAGLR
jgi:hypothetical protein